MKQYTMEDIARLLGAVEKAGISVNAAVAWIEQGKPFTCDTCLAVSTCEWAYDLYNINGECLAEK